MYDVQLQFDSFILLYEGIKKNKKTPHNLKYFLFFASLAWHYDSDHNISPVL